MGQLLSSIIEHVKGKDSSTDLNVGMNSVTASNIALAERIQKLKEDPRIKAQKNPDDLTEEDIARLQEEHAEAIEVLNSKEGWIFIWDFEKYASKLDVDPDSMLLVKKAVDPVLDQFKTLRRRCHRELDEVPEEHKDDDYEQIKVISQADAIKIKKTLNLRIGTRSKMGLHYLDYVGPETRMGLREINFEIRSIPSEWIFGNSENPSNFWTEHQTKV